MTAINRTYKEQRELAYKEQHELAREKVKLAREHFSIAQEQLRLAEWEQTMVTVREQEERERDDSIERLTKNDYTINEIVALRPNVTRSDVLRIRREIKKGIR